MAEPSAAPETVRKIRVSQVECDVSAGSLRCIARLAPERAARGIAAIWRNEVGPADCTAPVAPVTS